MNGVVATIVGVMPRGFVGLSGRAQAWGPVSLPPRTSYADYLTTNQNFISMIARLRPGVTIERARDELARVGREIQRVAPSRGGRPRHRARRHGGDAQRGAHRSHDAAADAAVARGGRLSVAALVRERRRIAARPSRYTRPGDRHPDRHRRDAPAHRDAAHRRGGHSRRRRRRGRSRRRDTAHHERWAAAGDVARSQLLRRIERILIAARRCSRPALFDRRVRVDDRCCSGSCRRSRPRDSTSRARCVRARADPRERRAPALRRIIVGVETGLAVVLLAGGALLAASWHRPRDDGRGLRSHASAHLSRPPI